MEDKKLYSEAEIKFAFAKWHEAYVNETQIFNSIVAHIKTDPLVYAEQACRDLLSFMQG